MRKVAIMACIIAASCIIASGVSRAAGDTVKKETFGEKLKNFGQRLFSYPANVIQGSVSTVAETGKRGTEIVTDEIKTVGQVATGDIDKTKDLVTEPLTGTAETVVKTAEETVNIPVDAAKE